jgi:hypothetical protein
VEKLTKRGSIKKNGETGSGDTLSNPIDPHGIEPKQGEDLQQKIPFHRIKGFFHI